MTDRACELLERALEALDFDRGIDADDLMEEIRAYLAEPEVKRDDEPVAWIREVDIDNPVSALVRTQHECGDCNIPLYLHPEPKVPFVRLTDEEIMDIYMKWINDNNGQPLGRAIEDALEEKNK